MLCRHRPCCARLLHDWARGLNHRLLGLTVRNFRTLTDTKLPLGPLTVMVGPNAAGKSNVLHALEFLGDVARQGIEPALDSRGGFDVLAFRGGRRPVSRISIGLDGVWSDFASLEAPDRYELSISRPRLPGSSPARYRMFRQERFTQHPVEGFETAAQLTSSSLKLDSALESDNQGKTLGSVGRPLSRAVTYLPGPPARTVPTRTSWRTWRPGMGRHRPTGARAAMPAIRWY
ncbi:AAA family ATPase [Streptomyces sp. NPDC001373]|uniref:AAA family ATPase n=1 Tax=Streptomyces sp. NPDC001373 TaxID=3364565 RepID=UPI0036855145